MNPLLVAQIFGHLLGGVAQLQQQARQNSADSEPRDSSMRMSPDILNALIAAASARPIESAPPKMPLMSAFVSVVILLSTIAAMVGIAWLIVDGKGDSPLLPVLCVGFGALLAKLSTVVDFWFGSSWGSKSKEARPTDASPVVIPPVTLPQLPAPEPESPEHSEGIGHSTNPSTVTTRIDIAPNGQPASIRYNNPGAQYPSEAAAAFGQIGYGIIGGGHKIARFPHPVNGAAANIDLLFRKYRGMSFRSAGAQWTGSDIAGKPGWDRDGTLDDALFANADAFVDFLKGIARNEAGKASPVTDEQWRQAYSMWKAGSADHYLGGEPPASAPSPVAFHTGSDLLSLARTRVGEKYVNVQVPKDDPNYHGPWDCAEFASWLVYQVSGLLYGCIDNNAAPAKADAYTGAWKRDAQSIGRAVSVQQAAGTPGAFLLRYPPSSGAMGHIVISDGKGGTVEAMGTAYGVTAGKVSGRRWDTGVLPPGINYASGGTVDVAAPGKIYALGQPNMDPAKVREIQTLLHVEADGEFGPSTAAAAAAFQQMHGLVADGEIGPQTAGALGVTL